MADRLVVSDESGGEYYLQWFIAETGDLGGYLGQSDDEGTGNPPHDRAEWDGWAASHALRAMGAKNGRWGFVWHSRKEAEAALRVAKQAMKADRPMPDWAVKAAAEGWKPPKGWRP